MPALILACLAGCATVAPRGTTSLPASARASAAQVVSSTASRRADRAQGIARRPRYRSTWRPGAAGRLLADGARDLAPRDDPARWKGPDALAGATPGADSWSRVGAVEPQSGFPPPREELGSEVLGRLVRGFGRGQLDLVDLLLEPTLDRLFHTRARHELRRRLLERESAGEDTQDDGEADRAADAYDDYLRATGRAPIELPPEPSRGRRSVGP